MIRKAKKVFKKVFKKVAYYADFTKSCLHVACNLYKNKVYKISDYLKACNMAWSMIHDLKNYKPFAQGNNKLNKNILIFDIPEKITCKYSCKNCYACKASRLYKNTRVKRLYNYILVDFACSNLIFANKLLKHWQNITNKHVKSCNKNQLMPILRVHASGDFYNIKYYNFIVNFAQNFANKELKIYSYSKQLDNEKIDINNKYINNFNIVKSIFEVDNKKCINFGDIEYIIRVAKELKKSKIDFAICAYKLTDNDILQLKKAKIYKYVQHGTCGQCTACMSKSIVLFKIH